MTVRDQDGSANGGLDRALGLLADCALATREARFDRLPGLIEGLEAELSEQPATADAAGLRRIREGLWHNRRLLDAALRGVQAAQRRVAEVGESLRTLNTYDSQGRRAMIRPSADGFERKA